MKTMRNASNIKFKCTEILNLIPVNLNDIKMTFIALIPFGQY